MKASIPSVSVVIPCRNEVDVIEDCLRSVIEQQPPEGGFEIVVADGCSDDGTKELLEGLVSGLSGIRVIENPARIQASGLNAAIRVARGTTIIRMDAHTVYARDYLRQCVQALEETRADNVGGPARTKAEGYTQRAVAAAYHSLFAVGGARFHDVEYEGYVDTVTYGCWHKATFQRFGFFDEELVRNEDDEHNLRIKRGGGKIYQTPKIRSWYKPRGSLGALFKQYMQYGYWKVRLIQKHKLPAAWRHLVPAAFVLTLLVLSLGSLFWLLLSVVATDHGPRTTDLFWLPVGLLVGSLGLYGLAALAASVVTAARSEWKLLRILPFVFPCYHFGYGYGFLQGIWDFVIRRKVARRRFEALTR